MRQNIKFFFKKRKLYFWNNDIPKNIFSLTTLDSMKCVLQRLVNSFSHYIWGDLRKEENLKARHIKVFWLFCLLFFLQSLLWRWGLSSYKRRSKCLFIKYVVTRLGNCDEMIQNNTIFLRNEEEKIKFPHRDELYDG